MTVQEKEDSHGAKIYRCSVWDAKKLTRLIRRGEMMVINSNFSDLQHQKTSLLEYQQR